MAKLKATYDKEADIPEQYKDLFKLKGEQWAIEIDGIQTDANVARLEYSIKKERDENAKLREEAKLHGKTPEEVQALVEELEAANAAIASGSGKATEEQVQKLVEAQVRTKIGPLERNLVKVTKERDDALGVTTKLTGEITDGKIELAIMASAEKAKVRPEAIPDLVRRGKPLFELIEQDGKINIVTRDGLGVTPGLVPDGWVEELAPTAPHYWPGNLGAGANGSGGQLGITEANPWSRKNWNMTQKGDIIKKYGTEKAEQLAKSVGSSLYALDPPAA